MASSGKKKTTMAKLNRESRMRERRLDKQARKNARKQAAAQSSGALSDTLTGQADESIGPDSTEPTPEAGIPALVDA
jgi:hypothetical protein